MAQVETHVIILLGPPGAGKGSQATLIKERVGFAHISTGDLLRENIKDGTSLGKKAKGYMDEGKLVPDELIFDMLFDRVKQTDCKKGYILDGFPRNIPQARVLKQKLEGQPVTAIYFSLPDSVIVERIAKRIICKSCQRPYHLFYSPPKAAGKCDACGSELYQRSDDTKEVVEKRLKVYHEQTAPLIDYFQNQQTLHEIDSSQSKEAIVSEILNLLAQFV